MGVPTRSETFTKLLEHLTKAQEEAAMMAHLHNTEGNVKDVALAMGWLKVSENLKKMQRAITKMAQGRLQ